MAEEPTHVVNAEAHLSISATASASVTRFYDRLYAAAQAQLNAPDADEFSFGAAIVMAETAVQVAVERTLDALMLELNLGSTAEAAVAWINQYNLKIERIRDTWNAITGDIIQQKPFWQHYVEHVDRRHAVAHNGLIKDVPVTRQDAEASLAVVRAMLDHIRSVLAAKGLPQYT